jgi:glycosyltransferase involved in cell wall biosynthesis
MNVLFIHQNFPGQFKHLAPALAAQPGNRVVALTLREGLPQAWGGVEIRHYQAGRTTSSDIHPWVQDFETKTIRAEACFRAALALAKEGFTPDIIIAHPGWGESLFIKEAWPDARLGIYCEFYYHSSGATIGFDPEFPDNDPGTPCRLRLKNTNNILHFDLADAAISPTHWQASTFPLPFREKIAVIHDGIDTRRLVPADDVWLKVGDSFKLTRNDEIITFANRNLEPLRGYHIFMRALPELLERRPKARIFIVGGDEVSYGAPNPEGKSWKQKYLEELQGLVHPKDLARVHFIGKLLYPDLVRLLQLSSVHVYLTYPFVLSWSLLEAMSIGCAIVASDTNPLQEVITHGETGRLIDFFDTGGLVEQVISLLDDADERQRLGANARQFAVEHYDLKTVCLPRQLEWVRQLAAAPAKAP